MGHYDLPREVLQEMLAQLEQALVNHQQWFTETMRSITCKLPGDQSDLSPEAHRACRFGRWYYSGVPEKFRDHPGFIALGDAHKLMHQLAAKLLMEAQSGNPIKSFDYDNFSNARERMRLEISALSSELENLLHNHDALTGAINRFGILPAFREQQTMVMRGVQTCSIAMMDLDHFKKINDLRGHLAGDRVLTAAVRYMIDHLRPYDKIFRYGGEEFLILMQHTELAVCHNLVERLCEGLASLTIDFDDQEPIHVTGSFGVTLLDPDVPVETSIDRADKAMYAAKAAGRNCVRTWDSAM